MIELISWLPTTMGVEFMHETMDYLLMMLVIGYMRLPTLAHGYLVLAYRSATS